ncbi:tetratricopeptide repeat protein [Streptomyces scopuliridis]|uniref:Tetratricopeptide repeat protein n=1 Tax=Streptomyces scopuliridis TaxID=452529 RepID=A0ACD4ZBP7_9ACTN|nr:BTAD domain-containing putative transcriptional regulator [Streptomyces scopuliridis]WSB95784.1 tetratricopeptide repeat protein [Streptomyces scopuliridis]WSC10509.1 tetratricopeptide repeat protein [Streptomyces scopuliridis]
MAVEFGLLGTIEMRVDSRPADAGHLRQRCVLAALLVDANRVIPADELIDRIWADRAPQRARGTLHGYLSRLRQTLQRTTHDVRIVRQPGGYLLEVDAAAVDLHRFRDLVGQARMADDERAATLMGRALELWRGEPFATVDTPWFCDLRQALERERLSAELDNTDIRLRSGLHGELLPGLTARAAQHPLDERLTGQFMLALYRSGRASDALTCYHRLRRRLAEELGTDPGPQLQQLHQQILTADHALTVPKPEPAPHTAARTPIPRQLPSRPSSFTGREHQVAALTKALDSANEPGGTVAISAIGGSGGIGKTWLALHWAHDHINRFPDGQLYVDLRGFDPSGEPVTPAAAVRGFLDALGVDSGAVPVDVQAQIGLYRSLVQGKRMLIMLDNAADAEQAAALLPGSTTCTVLVTSRRRLAGLTSAHGARMLTLDVLTDSEARELIHRHLGEGRAAAEPEAVAALLKHCAGLPLAISVVAARAAAHPDFPLTVLAEDLQDESARLDALDAGDLTSSVRAAFTVSYRALTVGAAEVFRLVALAPGPEIGLAAVGSLVARPATAVRVALRELENAHLIRQFVPGRYRLHDLVRLYAAERAGHDQPEESRQQAMRRLTDFYLHTTYAGDRILSPMHHQSLELGLPSDGSTVESLSGQEAVLTWFRTEHACLLAAQRLAAEQGWDILVWQLAWVLDGFLWRQGRLHDHVTLWRTALAAAERLGMANMRARAHRRLGHVCARAGNHDDALEHTHLALASAEEAGDITEQARVHDVIAWAWAKQGDDRQALTHVRHTLRLQRMAEDPLAEANALNAVGWYEARTDNYEQALAHCEQALALHRRHAFPDGEACTLDSLGYIAHSSHRHAQALAYYRQAHTLFQKLGNNYEEANTLAHIGDVHHALGQHDQARQIWQEAADLYQTQHREDDAKQLRDKLRTLKP